MPFDPLSGLDPTGQAALLSSIAASRGMPLFGSVAPTMETLFPTIPLMPRGRRFQVPLVSSGRPTLDSGGGGGGGGGEGTTSTTTTSVDPLVAGLSTFLGAEAARSLVNLGLGAVGGPQIPGTVDAVKAIFNMLTGPTKATVAEVAAAEAGAGIMGPSVPPLDVLSPEFLSAFEGTAPLASEFSNLAAFEKAEAFPLGDALGQVAQMGITAPTAAEVAAAEAGAGIMGPGSASSGTGTFVGPELDVGVGLGPALSGALALSPIALNAIQGRTGEGAVAQNVGAMLSAALALSGVGLPAAIPGLLGTALGFLFDPEKESAQSRWEGEQAGNRSNFANTMSQAQSLEDVAGIFNAYAGRNYRASDWANPVTLRNELGGAMFDPSGAGGNVAVYTLLNALRQFAPTPEPAQTPSRPIVGDSIFPAWWPEYGWAQREFAAGVPLADIIRRVEAERNPEGVRIDIPQRSSGTVPEMGPDWLGEIARTSGPRTQNVWDELVRQLSLPVGQRAVPHVEGADWMPLARILGMDIEQERQRRYDVAERAAQALWLTPML